jgi:hypothetical protein
LTQFWRQRHPGAEVFRRLASNQSTSALQKSPSPARFRGKVIILDFDYNAVLETSLTSVLKLPMN